MNYGLPLRTSLQDFIGIGGCDTPASILKFDNLHHLEIMPPLEFYPHVWYNLAHGAISSKIS